jgi:hypothetical protein
VASFSGHKSISEKRFELTFSKSYMEIEKGSIQIKFKKEGKLKEKKIDLEQLPKKYVRKEEALTFISASEENMKYQTLDVKNFCTNYEYLGNDEYRCLGHTNTTKNGFGKTNQHNFHGEFYNGSHKF